MPSNMLILYLFLLSLRGPSFRTEGWSAVLKVTVWVAELLDVLAACFFCFTFPNFRSQGGRDDISQAPLNLASLGCGTVSALSRISVWLEPKQTLSSTQEVPGSAS